MKKTLKDTLPMAEGFARLLHPFAEVVLHDLEKDQIEAIFNPFSRREVGDSSYLDRIEFKPTDNVIGPYEKTNWDGRQLKSISIVLRNEKKKAQGFLCVNMDVSSFTSMTGILSQFLDNNASISEEDSRLFRDDLYDRLNTFVQKYCRENQVSIEALSREEKQKLILLIEMEGAFKERNAATYIARVLGISRATVYNYLKETEAA